MTDTALPLEPMQGLAAALKDHANTATMNGQADAARRYRRWAVEVEAATKPVSQEPPKAVKPIWKDLSPEPAKWWAGDTLVYRSYEDYCDD